MNNFKSKKAVYALGDPQTGEIRYIGCTAEPWSRLKAHIQKSKKARLYFPVNCWIKELLSKGLRPVLVVLCWTFYPLVERKMIREMRESGQPLLNIRSW